MLTPLNEKGIEKCFPYWPNTSESGIGTQLRFGPFYVRVDGDEEDFDGTLTQMTLTSNLEANMERRVSHYQYTGWGDHGLPSSMDSLIYMINLVDEVHGINPDKPIVVHCSAGTLFIVFAPGLKLLQVKCT